MSTGLQAVFREWRQVSADYDMECKTHILPLSGGETIMDILKWVKEENTRSNTISDVVIVDSEQQR